MQKRLIPWLLATSLAAGSLGVWAAPAQRPLGSGPPHSRPPAQAAPARPAPKNDRLEADARRVIQRTALVLTQAQQAAGRGRRYQGLARAIAHQQLARQLFGRGAYRDAINHSLRARDLAFGILRENAGKIRADLRWNEAEQGYAKERPADAELDRGLEPSQMGPDRDAVHIRIELNI
jgi:hypothetical protein